MAFHRVTSRLSSSQVSVEPHHLASPWTTMMRRQTQMRTSGRLMVLTRYARLSEVEIAACTEESKRPDKKKKKK